MFRKSIHTMLIFSLLGIGSSAMAEETASINKKNILTMVNVLTPKNGDQNELITQLELALHSTLVKQPGFISGSIHKSLDSTHVVNYAQWKDQASLEAFVQKLKSGKAPQMAKVFTIATPDYHPYSVVSVHKK